MRANHALVVAVLAVTVGCTSRHPSRGDAAVPRDAAAIEDADTPDDATRDIAAAVCTPCAEAIIAPSTSVVFDLEAGSANSAHILLGEPSQGAPRRLVYYTRGPHPLRVPLAPWVVDARLVVDDSGAHIIYASALDDPNARRPLEYVKVASGQASTREVLSPSAFPVFDVTIAAGGKPHVGVAARHPDITVPWYDAQIQLLRLTSSGWHKTTVADAQGVPKPGSLSIALSGKRIYVGVYYDSLEHIVYSGHAASADTWTTYSIATNAQRFDQHALLADGMGLVHLLTYKSFESQLATHSGQGSWLYVDIPAVDAFSVALAADVKGSPHVLYTLKTSQESTDLRLERTRLGSSGWSVPLRVADRVWAPQATVDPLNGLHVVYSRDTGVAYQRICLDE